LIEFFLLGKTMILQLKVKIPRAKEIPVPEGRIEGLVIFPRQQQYGNLTRLTGT
jgi:hypothetical protein